MYEFIGKVALVTGAGSGIGRSTSVLFAQNGATVVVADIDEAGGPETARIIQQLGGTAEFFRTDVAQPKDCEALVNFAVQRFGRLDFAVNNAGIGGESNPTGSYAYRKLAESHPGEPFRCFLLHAVPDSGNAQERRRGDC